MMDRPEDILNSGDITMVSMSSEESSNRLITAPPLRHELEISVEMLRNETLFGDLATSDLGDRMEMSIRNNLESLVDVGILIENQDQ